jgi:hypothetical protein
MRDGLSVTPERLLNLDDLMMLGERGIKSFFEGLAFLGWVMVGVEYTSDVLYTIAAMIRID